MANVTISAAAQAGNTLSEKLTAAYAQAPVAPDQLFVVIDASLPKHVNEILPTPPSNCTLLDYRTIWETPSNVRMSNVTIDFGTHADFEDTTASVTVNASWVNANSIIVCQVGTIGTADHGMDDAVAENIQARVNNIISGVSFDIQAFAPDGTWGRYNVIFQGLVQRGL